MTDKNRVFDQDLDDAANKAGNLVFSLLFVAAFAFDIYIGHFVEGTLPLLGFLMLVVVGFTIMQSYNLWDINSRGWLLMVIYNAAIITAILFVFPVGSIYGAMAFHVVYLTHYSGGYRYSLPNILIMVLVFILSIFTHGAPLTPEIFGDILRLIFIFILGCVGLISLLEVTIKQIGKERRSRAIIEAEKRRLSNLMNSISDAVIATDNEGVILEYNAAALTLLDVNQDIHGRSVSQVFNLHSVSDENVDLIAQAREKKRAFVRADLLQVFKEDDNVRLMVTVSPLHTSYESDPMNGFIIVMRDITREKSVETERNEFISIISHELRTPVAITQGNVEIAQLRNDKEVHDETLEKALSEADKNLKYLSRLVNDLVVLAMSEQSKKDVKKERFSPREMIEEVVKEFEEPADEQGNTIGIELQDQRDIYSSTTFVKEIIRHLVSNAVKYTKDGKITIRTRGLASGHMIIEVEDSGVGIAKSDYKHVFQKFFQAQDFDTREAGGTGLGLFVSKQLAERIDAKLTFKSDLHEGSTFSLLIPPKGETAKE